MNRDQVLAMRARGYAWRHIAPMCDLSTLACWMVYAPFIGARSR